jgi:hypothetical protein
LFLRFCPCNWGTSERADSAPKASVCISGGTQEIFIAVSEDLLGGTGKAEDAKSAGRRNYPEAVPNGEGRNGEYGPKQILSVRPRQRKSAKKGGDKLLRYARRDRFEEADYTAEWRRFQMFNGKSLEIVSELPTTYPEPRILLPATTFPASEGTCPITRVIRSYGITLYPSVFQSTFGLFENQSRSCSIFCSAYGKAIYESRTVSSEIFSFIGCTALFR